jgi:hypothetical protein
MNSGKKFLIQFFLFWPIVMTEDDFLRIPAYLQFSEYPQLNDCWHNCNDSMPCTSLTERA